MSKPDTPLALNFAFMRRTPRKSKISCFKCRNPSEGEEGISNEEVGTEALYSNPWFDVRCVFVFALTGPKGDGDSAVRCHQNQKSRKGVRRFNPGKE